MFDKLTEKADEIDMDSGIVKIEGEHACLNNSLSTCYICDGLLSDDPDDYVVREETCRRGCCHYGWEVMIDDWDCIINGNYWCEECYGNRKGILREQIFDYFPTLRKRKKSKIEDIEEEISRLKEEKNSLERDCGIIESLEEKNAEEDFEGHEFKMLDKISDSVISKRLSIYKPLVQNYEVEDDGQMKMKFEELKEE